MKLSKQQDCVRSAILAGIDKWNEARNSKRLLPSVGTQRDLCDIFMSIREGESTMHDVCDVCSDCPLEYIGKGCLEEDGYFDRFAVKESLGLYRDGSGLYLKDLEGELKVETTELIAGMIANLKAALKWFDIKVFAIYTKEESR